MRMYVLFLCLSTQRKKVFSFYPLLSFLLQLQCLLLVVCHILFLFLVNIPQVWFDERESTVDDSDPAPEGGEFRRTIKVPEAEGGETPEAEHGEDACSEWTHVEKHDCRKHVWEVVGEESVVREGELPENVSMGSIIRAGLIAVERVHVVCCFWEVKELSNNDRCAHGEKQNDGHGEGDFEERLSFPLVGKIRPKCEGHGLQEDIHHRKEGEELVHGIAREVLAQVLIIWLNHKPREELQKFHGGKDANSNSISCITHGSLTTVEVESSRDLDEGEYPSHCDVPTHRLIVVFSFLSQSNADTRKLKLELL
eukprot:TRINITY_DN2867_c0_g1_i1.p1 TRINITY_DN2867_c0_g1~~TRINITY_DN2867_c0_g1_i1.p1  ORF type:complete len:310 (+),score=54.40 TRINITY_DN2867_c0_g1_i1:229-1158(+)